MTKTFNHWTEKKYWISLVAVLIFAVYTLGSFGIYCARTLHGKVANHILIGEMFGIPEAIKQRGIEPLYYGPGQTGWDGQFYYYMANDLLGNADTPQHIDAPSYRYQRVGLSLYAKTMATLTRRQWVSPEFYIASYFLLLIAATWAGARIFAGLGANPLLILLWSLSVGTQITLFNGLPDAAADAFLIFAVLALLRQRVALSVIPFAMAGLSREVYALFPLCVLAWTLYERFITNRGAGFEKGRQLVSLLWHRNNLLLVPAVVVVIWQAYVVQHFHATPSSQAFGILGAPFKAWFDYFMSGVRGHHLLVGDSADARYEAASLAFFAAILLSGAWVASRVVISSTKEERYPAQVRGLALALLGFALLYACFGKTVIMHYTGYFKALPVFFFLVPLLLFSGSGGAQHPRRLILLLTVALAFTTVYNFRARLLPLNSDMYQNGTVVETRRLDCINRYDAQVKVNSVLVEQADTIARIFGGIDRMRVAIELTNTSDKPFVSSRNVGGTYMSYQWVDEKGNMIGDGIRTPLQAPLLPGQTVKLEVLSMVPRNRGTVTMMLSPVQEGCAWFYLNNPGMLESTSKIRIKN